MRYLLFLFLIWGCSVEQQDDIIAVLENAPDAGEPVFETSASYNHSLGSYKDSSEIKYCIVNLPPLIDEDSTRGIVQDAISMWADHCDKPFIEVADKSNANIYVEFRLMDGKGGQLGEAAYPPYTKVVNWNRPVYIDAYDVNGYKAEFDPVTIVGHEVGHAVGLKHSVDYRALLFDFYNGPREPGIDDILGARILYGNKKKFSFEGRRYTPILNSQENATEDFKMLEFFSRCGEFEDEFHFLDENLIHAIQIIRSYYDQPIMILSSYRSHECNSAVGGAKYSRHMDAQALDFKFVGAGDSHEDLIRDVMNQGCLFQTLINAGIGGFGAYATSFHIDTRKTGVREWAGMSYGLWGKFVENGYAVDTEHNGVEDL